MYHIAQLIKKTTPLWLNQRFNSIDYTLYIVTVGQKPCISKFQICTYFSPSKALLRHTRLSHRSSKNSRTARHCVLVDLLCSFKKYINTKRTVLDTHGFHPTTTTTYSILLGERLKNKMVDSQRSPFTVEHVGVRAAVHLCGKQGAFCVRLYLKSCFFLPAIHCFVM